MAVPRPALGSCSAVLEAVIVDLDGLLTDTVSLHLAAWQRLFDEVFVRYRSAPAFTEADYLRSVGGPDRDDILVFS